MTTREILERVRNHLLTQNKKSVEHNDPLECRYRTKDGLSCAVGCLIKNEFYSPSLEGKGIGNFAVVLTVECSLETKLTEEQLNILWKLQRLHDSADVECWKSELDEIEKEFCNDN